MLKIRLRRMGNRNRPFYRVVVSDSRRAPSAHAIDEVGHYDPVRPEVAVNTDRIQHWVAQGALLSPAVQKLVRRQERGLIQPTDDLAAAAAADVAQDEAEEAAPVADEAPAKAAEAAPAAEETPAQAAEAAPAADEAPAEPAEPQAAEPAAEAASAEPAAEAATTEDSPEAEAPEGTGTAAVPADVAGTDDEAPEVKPPDA